MTPRYILASSTLCNIISSDLLQNDERAGCDGAARVRYTAISINYGTEIILSKLKASLDPPKLELFFKSSTRASRYSQWGEIISDIAFFS